MATTRTCVMDRMLAAFVPVRLDFHRTPSGPGGGGPPPGRPYRDGVRSCSAGSADSGSADGAGVATAAGRADVTRRLL